MSDFWHQTIGCLFYITILMAVMNCTAKSEIKEHCVLNLASWGLDDFMKRGYLETSGGSFEKTLDEYSTDQRRYRGVTIFELNAATCTAITRQTFHTHDTHSHRLQLLEKLESARTGAILVGISSDCIENEDNWSFQGVVGTFFNKYNMDLSGFEFRDKFAFVLQKGYPWKTIFRRDPRSHQHNILMKVAITGSTIHDLKFELH